MRELLIFIALSSFCGSCHSAYNDSNDAKSKLYYYETKYPEKDSSDNNSVDKSDWGITLRVKQALLSDSALSISSRFVNVTTNNGVVTLTGTVPSAREMSEIIYRIKNVEGVKKVNNQMRVSNR